MMRKRMFAMAAGLALLNTLALAQGVTLDVAKSADFTKYKTYAWTRGSNLIDPLNHQRVVLAIDAQLGQKGLTQATPGTKPDALVSYDASLDTNIPKAGMPSKSAAGTGVTSPSTANDLLIGTLVVKIADARTKHVIWRGTLTNDIDSYATAEKREKNIANATQRLFENFPAAAAK